MPSEKAIRTRTLGYSLGIAAAWVLAAIGYLAAATLVKDVEAAEDARAVHAALEATRSNLREAESSLRGYLLTHDEAHLRLYEDAVARFDVTVGALAASVAGQRAQETRVAELKGVAHERLVLLATILEADRARGEEGTRELVGSGRGRALMAEVMEHLRAIEGDELARLREAHEASARGHVQLVLALVVQAIFVSGLFVWLSRHARRELEAAATFSARLEREVAARTEELRAEVATRRAREEELEALTKELERSNRELNDFAFIASHDLQEPLRKIRAFGDRIVSDHAGALDEEGHDFLERMQSAAERMSRLIEDLLAFSRVHRHAQPFTSVALGEVLRDVALDLEQRVNETKGRLVVPDDLPTIDADPTQMRQLFQNLLGNALKFHPDDRGNTVEVRARRDGDLWRFEIADDGIGFDPKYRDKIFGPFQRLHGRRTYDGTGIGLAICRRIVERHGGSLDVHSAVGEGTTFVLTLPNEHARPTDGAERSSQNDSATREEPT
jgi:signal transduction histidine kinase